MDMKRLITICLAALLSLSSFAGSLIPENALSIQLSSGINDGPRGKGHRAPARRPTMYYLDNYIYIQSPFNIDESQIIIRNSEGSIIYSTIITLNSGVNVLVLPMDVSDEMYNIEFIYRGHDTLGYF